MKGAPRSVSILGSTGSVGCNTVDLLARHPDRFVTEALVANRDHRRLAEQARQLRPRLVAVADESAYQPLKEALAGLGIEVAAGKQAVVEAAGRPADCVIAAIVGAAGLAPTLAAVRSGAVVGLANKEALVCSGKLLMNEAARSGAVVVPVDSEHSAIFQLFDFTKRHHVEKIVLTASGGPFRTWRREAMEAATPEEAVAHPNWKMGAKISVDSATMVNKGLEIIEAHHLFGVAESRIEVLVHPQSVIHGMVSYTDGSMLAQMGTPDMRIPISLALAWPGRIDDAGRRLDFTRATNLTFEAVDLERFPAIDLARDVLRAGGAAPIIFNAANEIAVEAFLRRSIGFLEIANVISEAVEQFEGGVAESLDEILAWDQKGRRVARDIIAIAVR